MTDPHALITDDVLRAWPYAREDLATFESFDKPTRLLVLTLLGTFGEIPEEAHAALALHPNAQLIATWLMTLPPYARLREQRDQEEEF